MAKEAPPPKNDGPQEPLSLEQMAAAAAPDDAPPADDTDGDDKGTPEPDEGTPAKPEPVDDDGGEGGDEGDEDAAGFLELLKEDYGVDLSGKYKDDDETIRGLLHATELVGQRHEDAEYGKTLRQLVQGRETELREFLASKQEPQPPADGDDKGASKAPEYDPAWQYQITRDDEGNFVPARGAPADVVDKYRQFMAYREEQLNSLVREPEKFFTQQLGQTLEKVKAEAAEAARAEAARDREALQLQEWSDKNSKLLHLGGDPEAGLTAVGRRTQEIYESDDLASMNHGIGRLNVALKLATAEQADKQPSTRKPPRRATRKPDVAAGGATQPTIAELFDQGLGLAEVAQAVAKGEAAEE